MICRLALEAYRQKKWPFEGVDIEDLREAMNCAMDYMLYEKLKTFPHDTDVPLGQFIKWARKIVIENQKYD